MGEPVAQPPIRSDRPRALPRRAALTLPVAPPFRLDLTAALLRRMPGNLVDVWDGGRHVRVFETPAGPAGWVARLAPGGRALRVELHGAIRSVAPWRARIRRTLGLDVDLRPFHALAARVPTLADLNRLILGVRPPRYAELEQAFGSVIPFQQVSLASGAAILRRLVLALSRPCELDGVLAWPFPSAAAVAGAPERVLRAAGLSGAKVRALQASSAAIAIRALTEARLGPLPTEALVAALEEVPGIGPWSAAILALRGFGRLDVFPPGDSGASPGLRALSGDDDLLIRFGPWRGMLYFLLSLRRMLAAPAGLAPERGPAEPAAP
jgi:DNA-3-methyladenine glycosylase II